MEHEKKDIDLLLYWLTTGLILIFLMIIVGGLTRLTNSGLSITEWELFKGILPPLNSKDWEDYFSLYKQIPQYEKINPSMNIEEFKIIFYWEYFHRIFGRIIGLFFLLPLLYFHFIKKISFNLLKTSYLILTLIIFQGIVGWYMVKSGLVDDVTVSHYRLSLHLSVAVFILSIIFWQILNFKNNNSKFFFNNQLKSFPYIVLIILIFLQIIFGAFVSGLDAGKIYQTWPLMGSNYIPDDFSISSKIEMLNFDNHSLVQFYHRNLAYIITLYILILSFFIFKIKNKELYNPIIILITILSLQIILGIITLLSNLNIILASAHQITSIILVLSALNLYYSAIK